MNQEMLPFDVQHFSTGNSEQPSSVFHADTIHHVEFNFYGQRVATVSSDKTVCIWDKEQSGGWKKSASWKKHGGAVWKARFAHPEYGQVLATCSFDNTIQIFDKDAADLADSRSMSGADSNNGWVCRTALRPNAGNITDIQFAPHYLGLQLAACSSSGRVVIYEAEDIMALDSWNGLHDFEVSHQHRLSSISWSTNRFDPPYIAVSSDDADASPGEKVFLFLSMNTGFVRIDVRGISGQSNQFQFEDQVSAVSFGPSCGLAKHKIAVAAGARIYIYQLASRTALSTEDSGPNNGGGGGGILPENGRSQHQQERGNTDLIVMGCDVLEESNSQVVRISWNIIGDVISAVCADGSVRVWQYGYTNRWISVSVITPPAESDKGAKDDVYY